VIKFINVYKNSLSVPYATLEKAEKQKHGENIQTRVLRILECGKIEDITDVYHEVLGEYHV